MTIRTKANKTYVVLLNWNGWRDTIECLESVLRSSHANYQAIVCDNASGDGSWEYLQAWAEGRLEARASSQPDLSSLVVPPVRKPVSYAAYSRDAAEAGGDERADAAQLIFIQTGSNLGFAGGNNVALRYTLQRDDFAYVWLLNNDTIVTPDTLSALARRLAERPDAGLCGSTLLYYDAPSTVQTRGGVGYNRWFATMRFPGKGQSIHDDFDRDQIERYIAYPAGASILVTREFLHTVGLMSENYFLYYEELDWVSRGGGRFAVAYSPDSKVYHKGGRSVDSARDQAFHTADYYLHRNRIRYTRQFFPVALPTVVLRTFVAVLARLWRGQPRRAWTILRLIVTPEVYRVSEGGQPKT